MSGNIVLGCFAAALAVCVITGWSVLYALLLGLGMFVCYGLLQRHSLRELLRAALSGIWHVRTILETLMLIGILSAFWRICGTIPFIVTCAGQLLRPGGLLLIAFLLCCLISVFTGTSFGTAATVGVICMTMAKSMGVSPLLMGGAVLSGSYFGDRCSPVSTSALLISTLTKTDLYANLRTMLRTALLPFGGACLVYALLGAIESEAGAVQKYAVQFNGFQFGPVLLLPAAAILLCACLRLPVKRTMCISILLSGLLAVTVQGTDPLALLRAAWSGFQPTDPALAHVLAGGGICSMGKVVCIVCISSAYSGLFQVTGLLESLQRQIRRAGNRITPYGSTLLAACCVSLIACNQTLTILLTHQLCQDAREPAALASDLEDSAVVIAPLVPWSIAAAVPLASVSAPTGSILAACFLYFLPLWRMAGALAARRSGRRFSAGETSGTA